MLIFVLDITSGQHSIFSQADLKIKEYNVPKNIDNIYDMWSKITSIDSPRQVRAIIVMKGEFQDLSERTLCNEFSSRFIHLHMSYMYLTDSVHHKKLHRLRRIDLPYIPRLVIIIAIH